MTTSITDLHIHICQNAMRKKIKREETAFLLHDCEALFAQRKLLHMLLDSRLRLKLRSQIDSSLIGSLNCQMPRMLMFYIFQATEQQLTAEPSLQQGAARLDMLTTYLPLANFFPAAVRLSMLKACGNKRNGKCYLGDTNHLLAGTVPKISCSCSCA
mmetsp:Transcript_52341/g.93266  ORF Transcript_52341/g.93266 Transcript_52341/m.93266 type:complete len:157 (+) Transcript_52341:479-949(+)